MRTLLLVLAGCVVVLLMAAWAVIRAVQSHGRVQKPGEPPASPSLQEHGIKEHGIKDSDDEHV